MSSTFQKSILSVTLAFSFVVSATVCAQTVRPPASVSLQAGLSLATVSPQEGEDPSDYSYQSGINVRASGFLPLSNYIGAQLGLGFVQKGSPLSVDDDPFFDGDFSAKLETAYLQVPVLLSVHPIPALRLLAGPVISFPLSCNLEIMRISIDCDETDIDLNTDLSIMAGAGVNIPLSSAFSLSLDVIYDLGLTDILEDSDSKNRGFLFTAGFSLPLQSLFPAEIPSPDND